MTPSLTFAGAAYALPFAALFRAHTDAERAALRASVAEAGVLVSVVTYESPAHGLAVVDGATRLTVALELGRADVPFTHIGATTDEAAKTLALTLNADRRHLTVEDQQAARRGRVARAAALRDAGLTTRAIAEATGVGQTQVRRDLAAVEPYGSGADQNVKALYAAQAAARRLSDLLDALLAGPVADRLRALLARHRADGAVPALVAALSDLAATAAQGFEE